MEDDCWFCGATLTIPVDTQGCIEEDVDIICPSCSGKHVTFLDDAISTEAMMSLAPMTCGHNVDADTPCDQCEKI